MGVRGDRDKAKVSHTPSPSTTQATEENKVNDESLPPDPDTRITGHPQGGDQGRKSRNTVQEEEKGERRKEKEGAKERAKEGKSDRSGPRTSG